MKINRKLEKEELKNLKIQTKRREKIKKETVDKKWIFKIVIIAFSLSFAMSFISEVTVSKITLIVGIIITLVVILIGILFDIIGVAVTASDESIIHSMNSRKVYGASVAVKFKKNAEKVSSFCCDVIGDVCGVISGSSGVAISAMIAKSLNCDILLPTLITTAIVASLTIGGKAIGKSFAINKSNIILYEFAKFITHFYKK